ncbi:MAG: DUF4435 domain-containing protein [Microcystaceae cyanobacterium]
MEEFIDADYRTGENILLGKDITAYVEGLEDVIFWGDVFRLFLPNLRINFYPYSQDNQFKNGKVEVLKNVDRVRYDLIICVDSDLDYLLKNETINSNPYIFQTYTYSIENYKIFPYNLNIIAEKVSLPIEKKFCFLEFFKLYSQITYPLLLYIVYFRKNRIQEELLHNKSLISLLGINQSYINEDTLLNNGENLLNALQVRINKLVHEINKKYGEIDLTRIKNELINDFHLNQEDTFWYLKGHILYDCVVSLILPKVIKIYQITRKNNYDQQKQLHPENKQIINKSNEYKNHRLDWKTLLKEGHTACLLYINLCLPMQKIKQNVEHYQTLYQQNTN